MGGQAKITKQAAACRAGSKSQRSFCSAPRRSWATQRRYLAVQAWLNSWLRICAPRIAGFGKAPPLPAIHGPRPDGSAPHDCPFASEQQGQTMGCCTYDTEVLPAGCSPWVRALNGTEPLFLSRSHLGHLPRIGSHLCHAECHTRPSRLQVVPPGRPGETPVIGADQLTTLGRRSNRPKMRASALFVWPSTLSDGTAQAIVAAGALGSTTTLRMSARQKPILYPVHGDACLRYGCS